MALEKGSEQFYAKIHEMDMLTSGKDAFTQLAKDEVSHAKLIYDILGNYSDESLQPFDELYEDLSGDIVEGGDTVEELFQYIRTIQKYGCIQLLEIALDVEFAGYDLYRSMANLKTDEMDTANILLAIAQAEKDHMQLIAGLFDRCSDD